MSVLRGMATLNFYAADLPVAKDWYRDLTGVEPYFEVPGYVEFRLGDFQHELGIVDARYAPANAPTEPGGAVVYWHVDDVPATLDRLLDAGGTLQEGVKDRGHGFVTASVVDPFGNILGIMSNPHYEEILAARPQR